MEPLRLGSLKPRGFTGLFSLEDDSGAHWIKSPSFIESLGQCLGREWDIGTLHYDTSNNGHDITFFDVKSEQQVHFCFHSGKDVSDISAHLLARAVGEAKVTFIVILEQITQEHINQLLWLNQITIADLRVYGVELGIWQVERSDIVLPIATAIVSDNGVKRAHNLLIKPQPCISLQDELASDDSKLLPYIEFWLSFNAELIKRKSKVVGPKPQDKNWVSYPLADCFKMVASVEPDTLSCAVGIVISGNTSKQYFEQLLEMKTIIEQELGIEALWETRKERSFCRIYTRTYGYDVTDKNQWPVMQLWLATMMEKFQLVFDLKINSLLLQEKFSNAKETGMMQKINWESASG